MVSGRMMMIGACPSLLIAAVMKDPYFNAGSRARHLTDSCPRGCQLDEVTLKFVAVIHLR
jgi:hypothetical protein